MHEQRDNTSREGAARNAAERAARTAYGKLVAVLAARTGDLHAAEDALSGALIEALTTWPRDGVPTVPEAWLLTAARNNLTDATRRDKHLSAMDAEAMDHQNRISKLIGAMRDEPGVPDERLTLLFVCAHPAIDASVRTPLMLQAVLGLSAEAIASAFAVAPVAMSQRLVRAKQKIRATGVRFSQPQVEELPARLDDVLDAIYAAFGTAYNAETTSTNEGSLANEALELAALVTEQLPDQAEAWGLRALMLLCHARRNARRDADDAFVPLPDQDVSQWDGLLMRSGDQCLMRAAQLRNPGRFQTEAAIQSAHMDAACRGVSNAAVIANLYDVLLAQSPTLGVRIARAAAIADAHGPQRALQQLDQVPAERVQSHQPYWAVRADILRRLGATTLAQACYQRAIALTTDAAVRTWLTRRADQLTS